VRTPAWSPLPGSIFSHSLFLVLGVVATMALVIVGLVVRMPPPADLPVSTYELGRLLQDRPIVGDLTNFEIQRNSSAPASTRETSRSSDALRWALAAQMGAPLADVRFDGGHEKRPLIGSPSDGARGVYEPWLLKTGGLYGGDPRFSPVIFGSFQAAFRQADGTWRVVSYRQPKPTRGRLSTLRWIALLVAAIVLIAWLFSIRLAEPIRAFARAADRSGRGDFEHIDVRGPTEIRIAARALNAMQLRLRKLLDERTSVIGAIAHDLRTPLTRLAFLLHEAPPEVRRAAEAQISEMERMIAVTLDFSQSETQPARREWLDLRLLVESVVDDVADMGHDATIEPGCQVNLRGDAMLLKRLFMNLVNNAITYGGYARVRLRAEGGAARVEIDDGGPGMSQDDLLRVFEPFARVEPSRNTRTGGIGLGLAIVRTAARAHRGAVSLSNRSAGGLRATVTLPLDDTDCVTGKGRGWAIGGDLPRQRPSPPVTPPQPR